MTCQRCGAAIRAGRTVCGECGAPVAESPSSESNEEQPSDEEVGRTRLRPGGWGHLLAGDGVGIGPDEPLTEPEPVADPLSEPGRQPPPPPVLPSFPPPASRVDPALPSVALTVVITFLFGLFGLIPASVHASRAKAAGESGSRYWKAFWLTMLASTLIAIGVVIAVVLALRSAVDGASGSYSEPYSTPFDAPSYVGPSPTPTVASQAFTGVSLTYYQTTQTGDTSTVTVELGAPGAAADAPGVRGGTVDEAIAACDLDEERDLLVPFSVRMTNTDDGLSQQVETDLYIEAGDRGPLSDEESVGRVAFYSDGPDCDDTGLDGGKFLGLQSTDGLAPGTSSAIGGYLILGGAVSPTYPEGDPALLDAGLQPLGVLAGQRDGEGTSYSIGAGPWQDQLIPIGAGVAS